MKVFLTGDQSIDPMLAAAVASDTLTLLAVTHPGILVEDISTGDLDGFERAVRYLVPPVTVVESSFQEDGTPDFDERHARLASEVDEVWFIHADPLSSSVYSSLVKHFSDDALRVLP